MSGARITPALLGEIMPAARGEDVARYAGPLAEAMAEFGIDTPARAAAFIAQVAHESGGLRWVVELADGKDYEGRRDLGNVQPGDGPRFKGRGLIQITGRANYRRCGAALGLPLEDRPGMLAEPVAAARSAAWFWRHGNGDLNPMADAGNFVTITRRINGGTNGLADRIAYWERAKAALGCDDPANAPAKPAAQSKTLIGAGVAAASGAGALADQAREIADTVQQVTAAASSASGTLAAVQAAGAAFVGGSGLRLALTLAALLAVGFVGWRYWRKVQAGDVRVR